MTRLDKIRAEFAKIGTDKNLEMGDFSIYHLAGFSGVLFLCVSSKKALNDPSNFRKLVRISVFYLFAGFSSYRVCKSSKYFECYRLEMNSVSCHIA